MWERIEDLDNRVPAKVQYAAAFETSRLLRHATYWLLARRHGLKVDIAVAEFRAGVHELQARIGQVLCGSWREQFEQVRAQHLEAGLPPELAARVASLEAHNASLDIVELAGAQRIPVAEAARVYFEAGARTGLDWLRHQIDRLPVEGPWQATARTGLRDAALRLHRRLTERVLSRGRGAGAEQRVAAWQEAAGKDLAHWQRTLADMRAAGAPDFATLTVGVESLRKLAE